MKLRGTAGKHIQPGRELQLYLLPDLLLGLKRVKRSLLFYNVRCVLELQGGIDSQLGSHSPYRFDFGIGSEIGGEASEEIANLCGLHGYLLHRNGRAWRGRAG